jgi:tetratricopeptide (TPR) repeat protein
MATAEEETPHSSRSFTPTLFGRRAETELITTLLSHAEAGSGTTALVTGPGGIGKTSLLGWLEEAARSRNLWVRRGYCLPGIQDPFFAMEQVLRSGKKETQRDVEPKASRGVKDLPLAFKPRPAGAANSGRLPAAFIPFDKEQVKVTSSAKGAPENVLLDYLNRIESEARIHPCVLLLDDFQWADPDSVEALRFLSWNIKKMPVLITVALRDDEVEGTPLKKVLTDLRSEGLAEDIPLSGLEAEDIHSLLQNIVKAPLDDRKAAAAERFLMEMTGGNPYFFMEVVRLWQERGVIRNEGGRAVIDVPHSGTSGKTKLIVPDSVSHLLTGRLSTLNEEETELLEAAAMLGQEFEVAPLEYLFSSHREGVRSSLKELSAKRWLDIPSSRGEGRRYAFSHALLWETVRESTPDKKVKPWAGQLASWWAEHLPADLDQISALYELGELNAKALGFIDKAIDLSLQMHAHERVARYFEKGLMMMEGEGTSPGEIAKWGLSIMDNLLKDGGTRWIEPMCSRLLKMAPPEPLSWELSLRFASVIWGERPKEARQLLQKVDKAARQGPQTPPQVLLGKIAVVSSRLLYYEGSPDESAELSKKALSMLPEEERYFRGLAYLMMGWVSNDKRQSEEAATCLEKGLSVAKEGKQWGLIPLFLNLKGAIAFLKGDLKKAEECFGEASATCRELGHVRNFTIFLTNVSMARLQMGDTEGAEKVAREALRVAQVFNHKLLEGAANHTLGEALMRRGLPDDAMVLFTQAKGIYNEAGNTENSREVDLDMVEAMSLMGDASGALDTFKRIAEQGEPKQDGVAGFHMLGFRIKLAMGAKDEAKAEVELALDESKKRGLRYWEGRALLGLSEWERKYESPQNATKTREEAEKVLKECGVVNLEPFTERIRTLMERGRLGSGANRPQNT